MFIFMDSVIIKAYRSPSLPYEDLPPLSDYDYAEYLKKRSFHVISLLYAVETRLTIDYISISTLPSSPNGEMHFFLSFASLLGNLPL
jgi:hypothetical protein